MSPPRLRDLAARLLQLLNERVRRGEMSERGLARMLGLSQPHIHNVLHGRRKLTLDTADHILVTLGITLDDLSAEAPASGQASAHLPAPRLEGPLGAGLPFPREFERPSTLLFPAPLIEGLVSPFAADISRDEVSMQPAVRPGDIVLFDRNPRFLAAPDFAGIYAVRWEGRGYLCRCRQVGRRLITVTDVESPRSAPGMLDLADDSVEELVAGIAVWTSRAIPRPAE